MLPLATRAPAKINLTLHVLGRRPGDGYHALESLVVFAGSSAGDLLSLEPGPALDLAVTGPTAGPPVRSTTTSWCGRPATSPPKCRA